MPVIVTARGMPELLEPATGARYVVLDLADPDIAVPEGAGILRSFHDWDAVPADCATIVESMLLRGGDLFKFVATPRSAIETSRTRKSGAGIERITSLMAGCVVNARTVGPAPLMNAGMPAARRRSTRENDSGMATARCA